MAKEIISGIYRIRNTVNGRCYIGSAIDFRKRWYVHLHHLRKGKHHSIALQRAWDKHGGTTFVFEILERVADKANLIVREQHWIDKGHGYNVSPTAGSNLGLVMSERAIERMRAAKVGTKFPAHGLAKAIEANKLRSISPEHKAKMQAARLAFGTPESTREKMRQSHLGRKATEAHKEAMRAAMRKIGIPRERQVRMIAGMKAACANLSPEERARRRVVFIANMTSAATRAKMSASAKRRCNKGQMVLDI